MSLEKSILVDFERLKYPYTGLFSYAQGLGRELIKIKEESDHLTYFLPKKYKDVFGNKVNYLIQSPLQKVIFPESSRFDIWHSTYQGSPYYPRKSSVKIIQTIHDLNFIYEKSNDPGKLKLYTKKVQEGIDRADIITTISEFTMQEIEKYLKIGNQEKKVIYNGCDLIPYEGFEDPIIKPNGKFLFSLGTVLPKKNFHTLPALLIGNDYELIIAGINDSPYQIKIWEMARRFKVENRVKLIGPIPEDSKYWYFKNCSAFLFPSLTEGFGLPAVESMYFGKPLFLSDKTSLPEIGGDQAFYFRSFEPDHMREVFEKGMSEFDYQRTPALLRARYENFTWKKSAEQYLDLYRK